MKVKIKKDWEHSLAPNSIFKRGEEVELSAADIHAGIQGGFVQDPNEPEVKTPEKVVEKATSKKFKNRR